MQTRQRELNLPDEVYQGNALLLVLQELRRLTSAMTMWPTDPNIIVDEWLTVPSTTILTLNPSYDRPVLITSIIASIPAGSTAGSLSLAASTARAKQFTITPGQAPLNNIAMVCLPSEPWVLSFTGAGLAYLEIMGFGLAGDKWRVI